MSPEQFGQYRLDEMIGSGGMGEVYRAYDTVRDREVAVKRLRRQLAADGEFQDRFRHEWRLAARLNNPHIVPIHDFGEIDGQLFIDMRLVNGPDLGTLLAEHGPLEPQRAVNLIAGVASALDAAHAEGLVHRDIKPSNVLVGSNAGEDFAYLADFGIARALSGGTSLTITGVTVGTLEYMAPERFLGTATDHRVDVYSLACLLHEALTASKPFPGDGAPAMMYAHVNLAPPQPSTQRLEIPTRLDEVVARGMAKAPAQRYPTAGALAAAARAALTNGVTAANETAPNETAPTVIRPVTEPGLAYARDEDRRANTPTLISPPSARAPVASPPTRSRHGIPLVIAAAAAAVVLTITATALLTHNNASGSSGSGAGVSSATGDLKIGFLGDLTGENSGLVIPPHNGAQMVIDAYNATNPPHKIQLIPYDSQGTPYQAVPLVTKAVQQDKIIGMIGPTFSGESKAADPILEQAKIPSISPSATNPGLAQNSWKYFHRVVTDDSRQGPAIAGFLVSAKSPRTAFVISDDQAYGVGLADAVYQTLESEGVTAQRDQFAQATSDYSSTVAKIEAVNPDVIFFGGYYQQGARLLKQIRDAGITTLFATGDGGLDVGLIQGAGQPAAEGAIVGCPCAVPGPSTAQGPLKKFYDDYKAKFGIDPAVYSTEGYDAATAFVKAIQAGNTSPEAINDFLKTVSFQGVSKETMFQPNGNIASNDIFIHQVKNGRFELLGNSREVRLG